MSALGQKLSETSATVGVVGAGYVGLPLSVALVEAGFDVVGYDINEERIADLRAGDSYVEDVDDPTLSAALADGLRPTATPKTLAECDVFVFAVPTDVTDGAPDMAALESAIGTAARHRDADAETLFVVSSTVYPGATNDLVEPLVREAGFDESTGHVAMVPERLNPNDDRDIADLPVNVGADTAVARDLTETLFAHIIDDVNVFGSTKIVETAKIIENSYRLLNISFANEVMQFAEQFHVDVWEVIEAASTKPFGFQAFYPGPGVGGHCIPVDPQFLLWQAENVGIELSTLQAAKAVNDDLPSQLVQYIRYVFEADAPSIANADILALGVTYKPDVDDIRHSPSLEICAELADTGGSVTVADPVLGSFPLDGIDYVETLTRQMIEDADLVVVLVDHSAIDFDMVADTATRVFDTRNAVPRDRHAEVKLLGGGSALTEPPTEAPRQ